MRKWKVGRLEQGHVSAKLKKKKERAVSALIYNKPPRNKQNWCYRRVCDGDLQEKTTLLPCKTVLSGDHFFC